MCRQVRSRSSNVDSVHRHGLQSPSRDRRTRRADDGRREAARGAAPAVAGARRDGRGLRVARVVAAGSGSRALPRAGKQPGESGSIQPGQVFVLVLPQTDNVDRPTPDQLTLSEDVRRGVLDYLQSRCVMGMAFDVRGPDITWISVTADLLVPEHSHAQGVTLVQERALAALYQYLNLYVGGPHMNGWPFGRDLHLSEIYGLLQRVASVEYVESVRIGIGGPGGPLRPAPPRVTIPRHGLICSGVTRSPRAALDTIGSTNLGEHMGNDCPRPVSVPTQRLGGDRCDQELRVPIGGCRRAIRRLPTPPCRRTTRSIRTGAEGTGADRLESETVTDSATTTCCRIGRTRCPTGPSFASVPTTSSTGRRS